MIIRDPQTGLLRDIPEYPIRQVEEPELLRDIYPYSEVPRLVFDGQSVPMNPAPDFFITDTTFRDGQQSRPPYKVDQIVRIFDMLSRLGGPRGVVRVSEFFLYTDKDKEAVVKCQELGHRFPEVTGWIRANKKDFELVKNMGLKETGILTSASDYHIFLKFNKTREQIADTYCDLVSTALDSGLESVRCHLEDITRADFYGFIVPLVQRFMAIAQDARKAVKIRLCDTMGYGVPYAEASLPRSIPKMIHILRTECGVPSEWLEWHGHNDFHKVLVNATTAWLYGCAAANCAILGFGERTGNPPLEGAIMDYISLKGSNDDIDTTVITELAEYFRSDLGVELSPGYPFVGANFNTTSAGIHADGMLKNEEIYNIFDTGKILNRPPRVNVTDKSGLAGIAHWVNAYLGLRPEVAVDKRHAGLETINDWVREQYVSGRVTSISDQEMLMRARMSLPEYFKSDYDKLREHAFTLCEKLVEQLAESHELRTMDHEVIEHVLSEELHKHRFIKFMYVVDPNGFRITKNVCQAQDEEKYGRIKPDEIYTDRDWFKRAVETQQVYITRFYESKITGILCVTVSAPIFDAEGELLGILGVDLAFEELVRMHEELLS